MAARYLIKHEDLSKAKTVTLWYSIRDSLKFNATKPEICIRDFLNDIKESLMRDSESQHIAIRFFEEPRTVDLGGQRKSVVFLYRRVKR